MRSPPKMMCAEFPLLGRSLSPYRSRRIISTGRQLPGVNELKTTPLSDGLPVMATQVAARHYDVAKIMGGLYGDGIIGHARAFSRAWIEGLREDIDALFAEALSRPGGA